MTDRELLTHYQRSGAADALCELMRRHIDMVHAVALREVRESHLADDVTQAVFTILMRRAKGLSPHIPLSGWLFKVTRYAAADVRKHQARRQRHEREAGIMRLNHSANPPAADVSWTDLEPHLNAAIGQLAAADRHAVVLRYLEGRSIAEIAASLGTSENTTRQRLSRALQRLRKHLAKKGVPVAAVALGVALEQAPAHAAPPALAQGLSAILAHGAVPSASIMSLVTGVLKTMRNAKLIFTAGISAAVLVLTATAYFAATAFAVDDKPSPTPVPPIAATAPVKPVASLPPVAPPPPVAPVAKFGPAKTPKATVVSAWNACLAGDEDGALSCFDGLTDAQTATLRLAAQSFHAFNDLAQAIGDKYGAQARQQFTQKMFNGVNPADVENGTETIDGTVASVDVGNSGPGKIALIKVGDLWKISPTTLATLSPDSVAQTASHIPAIKAIIANIKANKYATPDDLQQDLIKAVTGQ